MKNAIEKNMNSAAICETANRLHMKGDELWQLFYNTGADYLDNLERRLHRKQVFDVMFKSFLHDKAFGEKTFPEVMNAMRVSPAFWFWWSVQLWSMCGQFVFRTKIQLEYNIQLNSALIPHFILKQIFYGKQEPKRRPRTEGTPSREATKSNPTQGKVRKGVGSKV